MFAKIVLLCAVVAATQATTLLNSGILSPGLLSHGWGLGGASLLSAPLAARTSSIVSIPGAITTDKRIIGTSGLIGTPLYSNGIISNGLIGASPLALNHGIISNGLIGSPLALSNGLISPIGLGGATILK